MSSTDFSSLLLATESTQDMNVMSMVIIAAVVGVVFYLTVARPAVRDRRRHDEIIRSLRKSDRVVTAGGVIGLFVSISNDGREITLQVDDKIRLKFHRNYIVGILNEAKKDN